MLIGSRVIGTNISSSNFDIVVIVDEDIDEITLIQNIRKPRPHELPIDVIVLHVNELKYCIEIELFMICYVNVRFYMIV